MKFSLNSEMAECKDFQREDPRQNPRAGLIRDRVLQESTQKDGAFLRCPFFCRRAPHSEAFLTSLIQIVSGIRYDDAFFF